MPTTTITVTQLDTSTDDTCHGTCANEDGCCECSAVSDHECTCCGTRAAYDDSGADVAYYRLATSTLCDGCLPTSVAYAMVEAGRHRCVLRGLTLAQVASVNEAADQAEREREATRVVPMRDVQAMVLSAMAVAS